MFLFKVIIVFIYFSLYYYLYLHLYMYLGVHQQSTLEQQDASIIDKVIAPQNIGDIVVITLALRWQEVYV